MLKILRNNTIISVFLIPLLGVMLWWQSFQHPPLVPVKHTMPLFEMLWLLLGNNLQGKVIIAFAILLFEAFYVNYLIDKNNLLSRKSMLPAFIFVLIGSCFKDSQLLSPLICGFAFVLFSFNKILKTYRHESALSQVFDASILLSIASLFYFPFVILYPFVWASLIVIRPFIWREWMVSFIGFVLLYLFVFTFYYWFNRVNYFVFDKVIFPESFHLSEFITALWLVRILFSTLLFFTLWGIAKTISRLSKNTIFTRNVSVIMLWFFFLSIGTFFLAPKASFVYLFGSLLPITYYFSSVFIDMKRAWIGETFFIIFIALVFSNIYFT